VASSPGSNLCDRGDAAVLATDPFRSLRVHFGMLLGVDDFEAIGAYHRGKGWLHNAWLHREGAVWGLGVAADLARGELKVLPGLALDGLGRELHHGQTACLSLAAWYEANKDDGELKAEIGDDGSVSFDAHVVLLFKTCPARQVPALAEPCSGNNSTTAASRVDETVELRLVPGRAPAPPAPPYHRLRLLFGLEPAHVDDSGDVTAADQEVLAARDAVAALPDADQPPALLEHFRRFAALDAIDLSPRAVDDGELAVHTPEKEPAPLVLADVTGIKLTPKESGGFTVAAASVDPTVRPTHVATRTIQELLCGPLHAHAGEAPEQPAPEQPAPEQPAPAPSDDVVSEPAPLQPLERVPLERLPTSPRVKPDSVKLDDGRIVFALDAPIAPASINKDSLSVTAFDPVEGWRAVDLGDIKTDETHTAVTVTLSDLPSWQVLRLLVRGSGRTPLLGARLDPLGDGTDFSTMLKKERV
jgi:hypothetical protein